MGNCPKCHIGNLKTYGPTYCENDICYKCPVCDTIIHKTFTDEEVQEMKDRRLHERIEQWKADKEYEAAYRAYTENI
nr:MAG TPA: cysteine-rich protein [Bacteriophage sp.]